VKTAVNLQVLQNSGNLLNIW